MALTWILALLALAFLVHACWALARDARAGYDVGMGAAGLFSGQWLIGSTAGAWAMSLALGIAWYWGAAIFVVLFLLKGVTYNAIVAANLGKEAAPPPKDGFKAFMRRAEEIDKRVGDDP